MSITVSSSVILLIPLIFVVVELFKSVLKFVKYKNMYGEMITHGIPSVKQARRYAELRGLEYRCYGYLIAVILLIICVGVTL